MQQKLCLSELNQDIVLRIFRMEAWLTVILTRLKIFKDIVLVEAKLPVNFETLKLSKNEN